MDWYGFAAVITAAGTFVAAIGAVFLSYRGNARATAAKVAAEVAAATAAESKVEIVATRDGVFEVGRRIDGRLSELLLVTEAAAHAAGRLEGVAAEKAAAAAAAVAPPGPLDDLGRARA